MRRAEQACGTGALVGTMISLGTLINVIAGRMSSAAVLVVLFALGVTQRAAVLPTARWRLAWKNNPGGR